jgi:hypothetical protein
VRSSLKRLELARIEVLDLIARGEPARDVLRMHGIANSTFWLWLTIGRETVDEDSPYKRLWLKYQISKESGRRKRQAESEKRKADPQMYENNCWNEANPKYLDAFTKLAQDAIIEKLRSGCFLDDSFLAAGVQIHHARYWMEQGHRISVDEVPDTYGFAVFYRNVLIAQATARSEVASRLMKDSPALWAISGPGRSTPEREGWEKHHTIHQKLDQKVSISTSWATAQHPQIVEGTSRPYQISFTPTGDEDEDRLEDEG